MGLPTMSGDYKADKMVGPYSKKSPKSGGFHPNHLIMTGINNLYEGITVAEMNENELINAKCEVVLHNSPGNPTVALRPASSTGGKVIIDGAFTKLYYKHDSPGSKRFWINSACYLAAQ